ncbi:branched-chain amino acid transaminase [Castellaniella sp.]|uniref:branched-chain amino acid transaminase n=1 Tax=Castellaniella sp. TaxID=1955812 RepID=UPI00356382B9
MMNVKMVYLNGDVVPYEQASVPLLNTSFRYGAMVFEGIRAYWDDKTKALNLFRLDEHAVRLLESIKLMRFEAAYTQEQISQAVVDYLKVLAPTQDVHLRQMVFLDSDEFYYARGPLQMAVAAVPMGRRRGFEKGIHCNISSWRRISDQSVPPRIKCAGNYQNSRLAHIESIESGYDYPLILNDRGKVSEGAGSAVMLVRHGALVTPPVTADLLESITRQTLIELARDRLGLRVEEREVDRTELLLAEEVFLCGTAEEVVPVVSVDRVTIGDGRPGSVTCGLQEELLAAARGDSERYSEWRTRVPN